MDATACAPAFARLSQRVVLLASVAVALVPLVLLFDRYQFSSARLWGAEVLRYSWATALLDLWIACVCMGLLPWALSSHARPKGSVALAAITLLLIICKAAFYQGFRAAAAVASFTCLSFFSLALFAAQIHFAIQTEDPASEGFSLLTNRLDGVVSDSASQSTTAQQSALRDAVQQEQKSQAASLRLFVSWLKPERSLIALATLALFISTICTLAVPQFFGKIIDDIASNDDTSKLNGYITILLFVFIVGSVFTFIRGALYNLIGERLVARLRGRLYKHIVLQDITFFDENKTGELMNRLASDTTVIQSALSVNVSMGLRSAAQVLFSVILLFVTSWKLTLVMMAVVPSLIISARVYGQFTKRISKQYQDALAKAADAAQECIGNARTVKSFGGEGVEIQRYSAKVGLAFAKGRTKSWAYGIFIGGIGLLANLAILLVLWYGGKLVIEDEISTGDLTAFMLYTIYIAVGLGTLAGLYTELMTSVGASTRIVAILHREPAIPSGFASNSQALDTDSIIYRGQDPDNVWESTDEPSDTHKDSARAKAAENGCTQSADDLETSLLLDQLEENDAGGDGPNSGVTWITPQTCQGDIVFRDVVFAYPTRLDTVVLDQFNLIIPANRRVALVGPSGSGKSTTLNLLQRFYDVQEGCITIDGYDVRQLHPRWLRKHMAIVSQEPVLFSGTVRDNIVYSLTSRGKGSGASCDVTESDIEHASRLANAHDFITSFPEGYDTLVGERGLRLSGGQKQRIAIARALMCDPKILLLDEATSALDSESEHLVQEAIERLMSTRTVIIIAHRLSTVKDAHTIAVVEAGRVRDQGSHEDLLANSETYQRLVRRQLHWATNGQNSDFGEAKEEVE